MVRTGGVHIAKNCYSIQEVTIQEKISHLKAIHIDRLFDRIIKANKKDLIKMNRDQMYEDGTLDITSGGRQQYAPSTVYAKKRYARFKKTEFITLKDMGDFHNSIDIKISPDEIEFVSNDEKWVKWLSPQDRFKRALGLTDENVAKLRDLVRDEMVKKLRDVI